MGDAAGRGLHAERLLWAAGRGDQQRGHELVRGQVGPPGPADEGAGAHPSRSPRATDLDLGVGGDQRGQEIGGRVGENQRTRQRGAVADLPRRDGPRCGGQDGRRAASSSMTCV